jgi:hypothetical protein
MKTFRQKALLGIASAVFVLAISNPASASPLLDFSSSVMGGDVVDLGGGHVMGTGALIKKFAWTDTPIGTGTMDVDWFLDFDSASGLRIYNALNQDLLLGTFSSTGFVGGPFGMFWGSGASTISASLGAFLMIDPAIGFDFSGFALGLQKNGFGTNNHYTPFSSDFGATPVPEPISLTLLGSGLVGLAAMRRRRGGLGQKSSA